MPKTPPRFDLEAVERAFAELIRSLGLDPMQEPELAQSPKRVAAMYGEIFSGLDPAREPEVAVMPRGPGGEGELVVIRDLPFYSLCVHHFVPFFGRATVAYLPGASLIGLSGAARVLDHFARRPQLQERITAQVADRLESLLAPRGIAVSLEARHLCMEMRGIRKRGRVETRVVRGDLADARWAGVLPASRAEIGPEP